MHERKRAQARPQRAREPRRAGGLRPRARRRSGISARPTGQISPILLPNPVAVFDELVDVLRTGEFIGDLRVTLTELAIAFSISVDRAASRSAI